MWQALLGAGINATVDTAIAGYNAYNQYEQQQWERQAWERSLGREDTAIQRRVADLRASGLSPVLAAGQGASTMGPIKSAPPQLNADPMQSAMATLSALQMQQGIEKTKAETDNIKLQKSKIQAETNAINLATDINASQRGVKLESLETELAFRKGLNPATLERAGLENRRLGIENTTALVNQQIAKVNLDKEIINRSLKKLEESIALNYHTSMAETELLAKQALLQLTRAQNETAQYNLETMKKLGLNWWSGSKDILETIGSGADVINKIIKLGGR